MIDPVNSRAKAVRWSAALAAAYLVPIGAADAQGCVKPPASSLSVSVKDMGAQGDGRTDDTAAIQRALDKIGGTGGTVFVPNGTYMINAVGKGLALKSNMTLKLSPGATLKVIPNSAEAYAMFNIAGVTNVTVDGGTFEGDRREHGGNTGEWGMGIRFGKGSKHVTIANVTVKDMWGDGFYVHGSVDVTFCSVVADNNRRQGLSVIDVDGLLVINSEFKNTRGTRPAAGIDFEPNDPAEKIINVHIENSKFTDNEGPGILISGKRAEISKVAITRNTFIGIQPIVVENAPGVKDQDICRNRQYTIQTEPVGSIATVSEPRKVLIVQSECGDRRLIVRRGKKGKKSK